MKKIMFNDRYGLTAAVLVGCKTMTRRIVKGLNGDADVSECGLDEKGAYIIDYNDPGEKEFRPMYQVGEVVAIAQSYKFLDYSFHGFATNTSRSCGIKKEFAEKQKGWDNKMFVEAKFMRHHIKITDIKVERLQDISDEDCLREGIVEGKFTNTWDRYYFDTWGDVPNHITSKTPREAFAALIDKISGKGTWQSNPWVFAYSFERID